MHNECEYFDSVEWDDRRWRAASEWQLDGFAAFVDADVQDALAGVVNPESRSQETELSAFTVGDVWPRETPVAGWTREDVLAAWDDREVTPDPPEACPHEPTGGDRCVFHGDADDETVRAAVSEAIDSERRADRLLSGGTFPSLDFRFERIAAPDTHPLVLSYATVDGLDFHSATVTQGLNLRYARVTGDASFHNATFERFLALRGAEFETGFDADEATVGGRLDAKRLRAGDDVRITRAVFRGSVAFDDASLPEANFFGTTFTDETSFDGAELTTGNFKTATFEGIASFERLTAEMISFSRARFDKMAVFDGSEATDELVFVGTTFGERLLCDEIRAEAVLFADATVGPISLDDVVVDQQINFAGATVEQLRAANLTTETLTVMTGTLHEGRIEVPDDEEFTCNLTEATLGDVTFEGPPDMFESFLLRDTVFDGFDFARGAHREALAAVDWNIHEPAAAVADEPIDFETTYLRAKQGADDHGDTVAASEFFVREMRHRRNGYLDTLSASPVSIAGLVSLYRAVSNTTLGVLTGYGERPGRVVLMSVATVLGFAVLYPATGGLARNGTTLRYGSDATTALLDSLYFSFVTFTTVDYGNFALTSPLGRVLAGVEAFFGAFVLALLVYILGRSIRL